MFFLARWAGLPLRAAMATLLMILLPFFVFFLRAVGLFNETLNYYETVTTLWIDWVWYGEL